MIAGPPPKSLENQVVSLTDNQFTLKHDLLNGWKPRVDLRNPFPLFSTDSLSQRLSIRPDWIYKGFFPGNSYELHCNLSGRQGAYNPKDRDIRLYKDLLSKDVFTETQHYLPILRNSKEDPQVEFDSFFESGNLAFVFRDRNRFSLFLRNDTNTLGHTQWFYFSVKAAGDLQAVFEIKNMSKPGSIFSKGGSPFFSLDNENWFPLPDSTYLPTSALDLAEYFPESYRRVSTLAFRFALKRGSLVYFAYSPPFTYSTLLHKIPKSQISNPRLCFTESGIEIPLIIYSKRDRPIIFVIARTHPGETSGSHMCQGMIEWLESNSAESRWTGP